jgi:hypothetical protein
MAKYRRRLGSYTWHWCRNCQESPRSNYEETDARPRSSELCGECLRLAVGGFCQYYQAPRAPPSR